MAHLVWDWNGTLLDDLTLVVAATNASLASIGGPSVTADEHRRDFRRPISAYYSHVLGREITDDEFARLDGAFHDAYRDGLAGAGLAVDAWDALAAWSGTQSLLSMWFHDELVTLVTTHGLLARLSRVDGLRATLGGGTKAPYLRAHLDALGLDGDGAACSSETRSTTLTPPRRSAPASSSMPAASPIPTRCAAPAFRSPPPCWRP